MFFVLLWSIQCFSLVNVFLISQSIWPFISTNSLDYLEGSKLAINLLNSSKVSSSWNYSTIYPNLPFLYLWHFYTCNVNPSPLNSSLYPSQWLDPSLISTMFYLAKPIRISLCSYHIIGNILLDISFITLPITSFVGDLFNGL